MKNMLFYILTAIIFLAPYKYMQQDNVNGMLFGIIAVFSIFTLKKISGNRRYSIFILIMTIISILSLLRTSITVDSMQGISLYLGSFILYFVFVSFRENEEEIIKILTYVMAVNSVVYMVVQGAFYDGGILQGRIDGNIGYANTYALLMLISLYFNNIRIKDNLKEVLDLLFIESILLTGSRNTLLYLGICVLVIVILKKKKNNFLCLNIIFSCMMAEFIYLMISKLRLGGILIMPIILILYYSFVNDKNRKLINILTLVSIPLGIISLFIFDSNLAARLASASVKSNELQLRIGYIEDVLNYALKNPLGGGLNTYMYNQGAFQTGFYDIRYVHNSFGQALYDMGVLGLIAFIALFISGILVIVKSVNKNKYYYLALYLTIYMHSILDFDFAYMVIPMAAIMIVAFVGDVDIEKEIRAKYLKVPLAMAGIYIFIITGLYCIGDSEFKAGNYESTVKIGRCLDKITTNDSVGRLLEFDGFKSLYYDTGDIRYFESGIELLESVVDTSNRSSYVYTKLASAYEELGDIDKSSLYYEKNLEIEKYSLYIYNSYCDMLTKYENITGDNYTDKKEEIMNRYNTLQAERSEKSKQRFKDIN